MAPVGLQPPDLVHIGKGHAVHLISAVFLKKLPGAQDTFAGAADVGQDDGDKIFFADAAGLHGRVFLCGMVDDKRVRAENALIRGNGLGGGHCYISRINAGGGPDSLMIEDVGRCAVAHGIVGKIYFDMADDRLIVAGLILRHDDREFLGHVIACSGVVIARDHGGAVVTCFFSYKECCAGHGRYLFS